MTHLKHWYFGDGINSRWNLLQTPFHPLVWRRSFILALQIWSKLLWKWSDRMIVHYCVNILFKVRENTSKFLTLSSYLLYVKKINCILSYILLLGGHVSSFQWEPSRTTCCSFFFFFFWKTACLRLIPIISDFRVILEFCVLLQLINQTVCHSSNTWVVQTI